MRSEIENQRIVNSYARDRIRFLESRLLIATYALKEIIGMDQESSEEYSIASTAFAKIAGKGEAVRKTYYTGQSDGEILARWKAHLLLAQGNVKKAPYNIQIVPETLEWFIYMIETNHLIVMPKKTWWKFWGKA